MQAVTFQGKENMKVKNVEDPSIQDNGDIIVRITAGGICGSDLHLYKGGIEPEQDYVVGHEPMGIVEEIGSLLHEKTENGADVVIDCVGMDGTVPPKNLVQREIINFEPSAQS